MSNLEFKPLSTDFPFGTCIRGLTEPMLEEPRIRRQIFQAFEVSGLILFEDVECTSEMQIKISNVFGLLKEHPVKAIKREEDDLPGVIYIRTDPEACIVEIDGNPLMSWQPWHFDHSYNNELNRAGVLRPEVLSPEGGKTGFADGIQIYRDMDPSLRAKIENESIIYTLDLHYHNQRWGLPENFREIRPKGAYLLEMAKSQPRSIHPAVWQRLSGEKVLHLSPYGSHGIYGKENPEGDALFSEVWREVERTMKCYFHDWKHDEMIVWDNWRMLHMACGCDPSQTRIMCRTTIQGDYGLGRWESDETNFSIGG